MNRRQAIKNTLIGAGASMAVPLLAGKQNINNRLDNTLQSSVVFPKLPYAYDALEPYIDTQTMEIHHSKHHAGYTRKFNAALADNSITFDRLPALFSEISKYPEAVRNNGGGFFNHRMFWTSMSPKSTKKPIGKLAGAIKKDFGSTEAFINIFSAAAKTQFGSGWAWLLVNKKGELQVTSSPNQDNPFMDISEVKGQAILNLDVWEHAYYLKYQNKRADYVDAFWNVVDWEKINERYEFALKKM